jgi:pescadillo
MLTFLEFYQTFLSFINYRLYTSINLIYPPKLDMEKDDAGAGLSAYLIQSTTDQQPVNQDQSTTNTLPVKDTTKQLATLPSKLASLTDDTPTDDTPVVNDEALDTFTSVDPSTTLPQPSLSIAETTNSLFKGLHIYLSRETPVDALTFLLLSFGVSSLSTDPTTGLSPYPESDPRITHQICDRGRLPDSIIPGRKYIQPQWVVDSINRGVLLDETLYLPGAELPAHLSPFVEKTEGKYDPEEELEVDSEVEEEVEDVEEQDPDTEHQRLLVAEATGQQVVSESQKKKKKRKEIDEDLEAKEMAKIMMSNKNKRLLDAMEYGNRKRRGETEKLQSRKRELIREERKRKKVKLG